MSSQIKSNSGQHYTTRSMNGIITFDDGAGNVIQNGQIISNGVVVDGDVSANNMLEADENETITGTWSFTSIPYSTITPTLDTQIVNKLYVDTEANTKVSLTGDETINGIKTFVDSPIVPNPTTDTQVANKGSYESFGYTNFASLTDNNTLTGINSFSNQVFLPNSNQTSDLMSASKGYVDNFGYTNFASLTDNNTLTGINSFSNQVFLPNSNQTSDLMSASKGYVDNFGYTNFVSLTDDQTIGGIKTFSDNLYLANSTPTNDLMSASKGYVDTEIAGIDYTGFVDIANNQTITGTKTYTGGLKYDLAPVVNTDVVNKLALDNAIAGIPAPSGVVLTTTNQNVGGVKTFTDTLQLNTNAGNPIKIWNGNGNNSASTAMGTNALNSITTGSNNTAMGISTLNTLTSGNSNTAFGAFAGTSVQGTGTTSIGAFTLTTNTADENTAVGYEALKINTSGANNTAVGAFTLKTNQGTSQNTAIGANCLTANTGSSNTGVGSNALLNNSTGNSNTTLGAFTMNNNTTGKENIAIGVGALYDNIDGNYNVAIGYEANDDNTTADNNIAIGFRAIQKITGDNNISIGKNNYSIYDESTANRNIVIGSNSGTRLSSSRTIIIGYESGTGTESTENIIIGNYSGKGMETSCSKSTCIGDDSGILTGSGATQVQVFGNEVIADESYFIYMGRGIQMSNVVSGVQSYTTTDAWLSSQLVFQNQNSSGTKWVGGTIGAYIKSNNNGTSGFPSGLIFRTKRATGTAGYSGLTNAMFIDCNGRLGINTNNPSVPLHVNAHVARSGFKRYISENTTNGSSSGYVNVSTSSNHNISVYTTQGVGCNFIIFHSDRRIKKNIEDVPDNLALQQVRDIPCRYYNYIDDVNKGEQKVVGFIAQEVQEVLPSAVHTSTNTLPNEYRMLENITWTDGEVDASGNVINYKMSCDLTDVSGVQYRFSVAHEEGVVADDKDVVGNEDGTFTFEEKYDFVFCYGKQIDDFLNIDKNQIFALHHSAIQEIDRQQIADKARITELETQVSDLTTRLQALEAHFNQ
jgi:hypothetical protein